MHPALGVDYRSVPAGSSRREGDFAAGGWDEDARDRSLGLVMAFLGGEYQLREGSATSGSRSRPFVT